MGLLLMKKTGVPAKTRVAADIMRLSSVLLFVFLFLPILSGFRCRWYSTSEFALRVSLLLIILFVFLFFPTCLLRGKRWGWWGSVGTLFLFTLFMLYGYISRFIRYGMGGFPSISGILLIVPIWTIWISALILFIIDKKNYWKISR